MGDGALFGGVERNRRLGAWRGPHAGLEQSLSRLPGKAKHTHLNPGCTLIWQAPGGGGRKGGWGMGLRGVGCMLGWRGRKEAGQTGLEF